MTTRDTSVITESGERIPLSELPTGEARREELEARRRRRPRDSARRFTVRRDIETGERQPAIEETPEQQQARVIDSAIRGDFFGGGTQGAVRARADQARFARAAREFESTAFDSAVRESARLESEGISTGNQLDDLTRFVQDESRDVFERFDVVFGGEISESEAREFARQVIAEREASRPLTTFIETAPLTGFGAGAPPNPREAFPVAVPEPITQDIQSELENVTDQNNSEARELLSDTEFFDYLVLTGQGREALQFSLDEGLSLSDAQVGEALEEASIQEQNESLGLDPRFGVFDPRAALPGSTLAIQLIADASSAVVSVIRQAPQAANRVIAQTRNLRVLPRESLGSGPIPPRIVRLREGPRSMMFGIESLEEAQRPTARIRESLRRQLGREPTDAEVQDGINQMIRADQAAQAPLTPLVRQQDVTAEQIGERLANEARNLQREGFRLLLRRNPEGQIVDQTGRIVDPATTQRLRELRLSPIDFQLMPARASATVRGETLIPSTSGIAGIAVSDGLLVNADTGEPITPNQREEIIDAGLSVGDFPEFVVFDPFKEAGGTVQPDPARIVSPRFDPFQPAGGTVQPQIAPAPARIVAAPAPAPQTRTITDTSPVDVFQSQPEGEVITTTVTPQIERIDAPTPRRALLTRAIDESDPSFASEVMPDTETQRLGDTDQRLEPDTRTPLDEPRPPRPLPRPLRVRRGRGRGRLPDIDLELETQGVGPVSSQALTWRQGGTQWINVSPPYEAANFSFPTSRPIGSVVFKNAIEAFNFASSRVTLSQTARDRWAQFFESTPQRRSLMDDEFEAIDQELAEIDDDPELAAIDEELADFDEDFSMEVGPIDRERQRMDDAINRELGPRNSVITETRGTRRGSFSIGRARQEPVTPRTQEVDF